MGARTLHPAGVVHSLYGRALAAGFRQRVPARVEQDEQRLDVLARRDRDELREPAAETRSVGGPQLIVKEHAHGVHPDPLGHAELAGDTACVVGSRLEHLELVDRRGGDIVRAEQPALSLVPGVGAVSRPSTRRSGDGGDLGQCRGCREVHREPEDGSPVHHVNIVSPSDSVEPTSRAVTQQHSNRYRALSGPHAQAEGYGDGATATASRWGWPRGATARSIRATVRRMVARWSSSSRAAAVDMSTGPSTASTRASANPRRSPRRAAPQGGESRPA